MPIREATHLYDQASQPKQIVILHNASHNDIYDTYLNDLSGIVSKFLQLKPDKTTSKS